MAPYDQLSGQGDILLPGWFARWIMLGTTLVLIVAVSLVSWRQLTHKWRGEAS